MKAQNNMIEANEVARIIADATSKAIAQTIPSVIADTFARLGIVAINTHPTSVPQSSTVTHSQAPVNKPSRPTAPAPVKVTQGTDERPNYGDFSCKVGANRTKLPMGMFEGFANIILIMPDGVERGLNTDKEGRARLQVSETNRIGAYEGNGHHLVFTRVDGEPGVYDVSIYTPKALRQSMVNVRDIRPVAPSPINLEGAFDAPPAQGKVKRPRSAAQLANDARLGALATARHAAVSDTVVAHGTREQALSVRPTPIYVQKGAQVTVSGYVVPARRTR